MAGKYFKKLAELLNLTRRVSDLCGCDVFKPNFKICWRTAAVFFLINFACGFTFYNMYVEAIIKGNHYHLLKSASALGTALQGYAKLLNGLKQQASFRFLYQQITEIYETYEAKSLAYQNCLKNNISLVKKLLLTLFAFLVITAIFIIVMPICLIIFQNERFELMPFKVPFLDTGTDFGYYSTYIVHTVAVFFGVFGNFASDSWLFIFTAHIPLIKNILKCKFDDLDGISEVNPRDVEKSRDSLTDIIQWHQKYNYFCSTVKETFFWVIAVQVCTEFIGIISTIACIFLGIWPPAPGFLLYLFVMFYSYCSLGNIVEVSNDDVIAIIYDSCWYKLRVSEQKMILVMLGESQQAQGIAIGGVIPLSLSTALQLTKTVYTFSMMLMEFLN